jgi:heme oxygenase (biliverdin-IX-beta and delta-forming)
MTSRTTLREATYQQHRALELHPLLQRLTHTSVLQKDVIRIQQALAAYHTIALAHVAPWQENLGYTPFSHAAVLADDLERLGACLLPDVPALPAFPSAAAAVGYLYVAEGSLLGNRLIARHLASHLPAYHAAGAHYYQDAPERIANYWHPLCQVLETLAEQGTSAQDDLITSAANTFCQLANWFDSVAGLQLGSLSRPAE